MAAMLFLYTRFGIAFVLPILPLIVTILLSHRLQVTTRTKRVEFIVATAMMIIVAAFFAATAPYPAIPGAVAMLLMMWSGVWIALSTMVWFMQLEPLQRVNHDELEFHQ